MFLGLDDEETADRRGRKLGSSCPASQGGGCFVSNGSPGCECEECESIVVALDPFCCNVIWDGICAGEATQYCLPVGATCVDKKNGEYSLVLPPYSSTFSATLTRGYFFQAPLSFEISGLSVPNEQNRAFQNVQVILMDSPPVAFSSTTDVSLSTVFYESGVQAGLNISTSISVPAGKFVGILGATSSVSSSTMHNSYGAGCFGSNIGGIPVQLNRLLTQQSIANAPTSSVSSGGCYSIGRVELYYKVGGRKSKSSKSAAKSSSSGSSSSEDVDNAVNVGVGILQAASIEVDVDVPMSFSFPYLHHLAAAQLELENVEVEMSMSYGVPPSDLVV